MYQREDNVACCEMIFPNGQAVNRKCRGLFRVDTTVTFEDTKRALSSMKCHTVREAPRQHRMIWICGYKQYRETPPLPRFCLRPWLALFGRARTFGAAPSTAWAAWRHPSRGDHRLERDHRLFRWTRLTVQIRRSICKYCMIYDAGYQQAFDKGFLLLSVIMAGAPDL